MSRLYTLSNVMALGAVLFVAGCGEPTTGASDPRHASTFLVPEKSPVLSVIATGAAVQVSAGGASHVCAIAADGTIVCWGNHDLGMASPPSGTFVQLDAGVLATCAVRSDGIAACWGYDGGEGWASPPPLNFVQISVGARHTCGVLTDGTATCFGSDESVPAPSGTFSKVSAGGFHSCGIRPDATLTCWGRNGVGQATPPSGTFTDISAGIAYSCGVQTGGGVVCWGANGFGEAIPPGGTFVQVSAGERHTCGVRTDATIACWGWNEFGQSTPPTGSFTQVSASLSGSTCAVRTSGAVTCWGNDETVRDVPAQSISFTSTPPVSPIVGGSYAVAATGGGSGNPVSFSTLTPATCSVTGMTVGFLAYGTCTIAADQAGTANYFPAQQTTQDVTIIGAPLSVTAENKVRIEGGVNPPLTGSIIGIQNGDNITALYSTSASTLSPPGSYAIVPAWVDPTNKLPNYVATINNGTLTITPNASPVLGTITAPTDPTAVNTTISLSVPFTDADVVESQPYTATIAWGDGTTVALPYSVPTTITSTHTYTTTNVYTVTVTVKQNTLPAKQDTKTLQYIVVYDPTGGFVTGGGWITSPAGAYSVDPAMTGSATFGFVSKYQKGQSVPNGSTEFDFHAAGLNFKSTSYEWLVLAGAKAQYKGSGTINGSGNYFFMLQAIDGEINGGGGFDTFRIKIWDKVTLAVIYDNQIGAADTDNPTTQLGGGSIVIHAK